MMPKNFVIQSNALETCTWLTEYRNVIFVISSYTNEEVLYNTTGCHVLDEFQLDPD